MKFTTQCNPQIVILKVGFRPAGSSVINGKTVTWDDADQIIGVPLEGDKIMKYTMSPSCAKAIYEILDDVYWGAVIELTIQEKKVVNVDIVSDWMKKLEILCR